MFFYFDVPVPVRLASLIPYVCFSSSVREYLTKILHPNNLQIRTRTEMELFKNSPKSKRLAIVGKADLC